MVRLKNSLVLWVSLIVAFLVLRLTNLTILPIFADEAIYIRWSQVIADDPANRFIPLTDGKQPLFMWLTAVLLKLDIFNPLLAGRLVSVLAGFGGMVGTYLIAKRLFSQKVAFWAALLYVITPFLVFYDRLAVVDGLLTALGVWVFYLGVLLSKDLRLDTSLLLGSVLGAALLTKSPALFFVLLLPTMLIIFDFKQKPFWGRFWRFVGLSGLAVVIATIIYNVLRLSPLFYLIAQRRSDFVFSFSEVLQTPLSPFLPRILGEIPLWLGQYLTWPLFIAGLAFVIFFVSQRNQAVGLLALWFIIPLIIESFIAKGFTARYFVFVTPFLLLILAQGITLVFEKLVRGKHWRLMILLLLFLPAVVFDFWLLFNPEKAPIPQKERSGYLEEWSAGYGIKEVADFIRKRANYSKVLVGTEGFFGTLPDGLQVYLRNTPNVTVVGLGVPVKGLSDEMASSLTDSEVYLVANDSRVAFEKSSQFELVRSFPKAKKSNGLRESLLLFRVNFPK